MTSVAPRPWLPDHSAAYVGSLAAATADAPGTEVLRELDRLVAENRRIHDRDCVTLNPATKVMNPRAEAMLSAGLGSRPSLGYPGDKYETGLEAIERIEVVAAELAAEVFDARYVEIRVPSGAAANLYAFLANRLSPASFCGSPDASVGGWGRPGWGTPATAEALIAHGDAPCASIDRRDAPCAKETDPPTGAGQDHCLTSQSRRLLGARGGVVIARSAQRRPVCKSWLS